MRIEELRRNCGIDILRGSECYILEEVKKRAGFLYDDERGVKSLALVKRSDCRDFKGLVCNVVAGGIADENKESFLYCVDWYRSDNLEHHIVRIPLRKVSVIEFIKRGKVKSKDIFPDFVE